MNFAFPKLPSVDSGRLTTLLQTGASLADRALLGVATFLTGVLIGRTGPAEFGAYTMAMYIVFLGIALQESLISAPYTVLYRDRAAGEQRRYLGSVVIHLAVLGALCSAAVLVAAVAYRMLGRAEHLAPLTTLAFVLPCVLTREFARRIEYADLTPRRAILMSGGVASLQLTLAAALFFSKRLNATTALGVVGAASLIGSIAWLATNLRRMQFDAADAVRAWGDNLKIGRWIFATQMSELVRMQAVVWTLGALLSQWDVGVYSAAFAVAAFSSPVLIALSNILLPQIVERHESGGIERTHRFVRQSTAWIGVGLGVNLLALTALSKWLVAWIYGGEYGGTGHPLVVLAAAQLLLGVNLPEARALMALQRTDRMFWSQVTGLAATVILAPPLALRFGIIGAAYASFFGALAKTWTTHVWYEREVVEQRRRSTQSVAAPPPPHFGGATPADRIVDLATQSDRMHLAGIGHGEEDAS
jgi:O-antigen/teichoic acid export membrane protein